MSNKSNSEFIREILNKLQQDNLGEMERNDLFTEAHEFVDAVEDYEKESFGDKERIKKLEDDITGFENEEPDWDTVELGLDTFYWSLHRDNLAIQQEVESFVNRLRKKYIGVTA